MHIGVHINFGFHQVKPIEKIISEAKSLKELKTNLEYSLAGKHYEKDFGKALGCYRDTLKLGLNNIDALSKVLKIYCFTNAWMI